MRLVQRMIGGGLIAGGLAGWIYSIAPETKHSIFIFGLCAVLVTWGGILAIEGCKED